MRELFLNRLLIGLGSDEKTPLGKSRLILIEDCCATQKFGVCQTSNWFNQSIRRNLNANFHLNSVQCGRGSWQAPEFNKKGEQRRLHLFNAVLHSKSNYRLTKLRAIRQVNTFFSRLRAVTGMTWTTCYWKKHCNWSVSMI